MSEPFIGEIRLSGNGRAPVGWAHCDGRLLPIAQYDALFALIGTTYGGDGQYFFALPDLRGRVPVGQGAGPGLTNRVMGEELGSEGVSLTVNQMPAHRHQWQASMSAVSPTAGPRAQLGSGAAIYGPEPGQVTMAAQALPTGGGQPHDNMAPTLTLNYIIALWGVFPTRN